jgi:hypothetical protein
MMPAAIDIPTTARPALRWPADVATLTDQSVPKLERLRAEGDHPKLYAIGRALFTTLEDVRDWILAHEVAPGFKASAGGPGRGRKARSEAAA